MSYKLIPENGTGPLITDNKYIMNYILNSDTSTKNVLKLEHILSAGAGINFDFEITLNNQIYSARLVTDGEDHVIITADNATSILKYEDSAEGIDVYGLPINNLCLRTKVIDKLAKAGAREFSNLETIILGKQNRL